MQRKDIVTRISMNVFFLTVKIKGSLSSLQVIFSSRPEKSI